VDPGAWLDPPTRGRLLHDVFHRFMTELTAQGLTPVHDRDERLILGILERDVEQLRRRLPPPSGEVFQRELAALQQSARIFLREEDALCRTSQPLYFEVAVGTRAAGAGTLLDTAAPLELRLPDGSTIRARGSIDRIDRLPGDGRRFTVWDYKTGSSARYQDRDPFAGGRHVQGTLYLALAEARLAERVSLGCSVASFGYFFPGPRELGRRLSWPAAELRRGLPVVEALCDLLAGGCFPGSDHAADNARSDYAAAIGDPEEVAASVAGKLGNPDNDMLEPLRRLRGRAGEGRAR
jgi:hypothetical protein